MKERLARRPKDPKIVKPIELENERIRERNFDVLPTHISNVFILVNHGEDPDLKKSEIRKLRNLANAYVARSEAIKHLQELQQSPHEEMEKMAINNNGLRGIRDLTTGSEVQINPHTIDIFNEPLLKASLGEDAPKYLHKTVTVSVVFDAEKDDVKGFVKSVKRRLKRQGFSSDQINNILKEKSTLRVDQKELEKMLKKKEVKLAKGAWIKQIDDWKIVPRIIPSQEEIELTDEETKTSN
jgi:hypothetical protein